MQGGPDAALQLAIGREGVGLELSKPIELGPVTLMHARTRMVGVGFPLDVSGGVERFRHRRTTLETIGIAIEHARAERWLSSLTDNLLGRGPCEARLGWIAPPEVGVGEAQSEREEHLIWSSGNVRIELWSETAIAAFDLAFAPAPSGISAIAHRPRGIGLDRPATAIAGAMVARIARALDGEARGLRLDLADPTKGAAMHAFVLRGARIPTRDDLVMVQARPDVDRFTIELRRGDTPAAPSSIYLALDELDRIAGEGDIALTAGDQDKAREIYARALERAPRHRAILTRLAELDAMHPERGEAALSWLRDAQKGRTRRALDGNDLGRLLLWAFLHERIGAFGRARGGWDRAAVEALQRGEPRVAARAFSRAAAVTRDNDPQLSALLDRALAADPGEIDARWRRTTLHIRGGDDVRALEDVEHLEARSRGREARRRTLMRAAQLWHEAGRPDRAIPAWERALRHVPDDRDVVAGLGTALLAAGETPRAIGLLAHATTLPGDRAGSAPIVLELARALAERVGDLPAAIARARTITDDDPHAPYARALEGACRLQLGDQVGAERAYAVAADLVERRGVPAGDTRAVRELLSGAARVSRTEGRVALAMRLAMVALSLDPTDSDLQVLVRTLGRFLAQEREEEPKTDPGLITGSPISISLDEEEPAEGSADDQRRADALLARVKADPDDHAAIDELVDLLGRLGRDAELFALLSARWEDATPDERLTMIPRQRAVLERLAKAADSQGRTIEAQLYRDALRALR
jgi:cellulose synthase operon protein C